MFVKQTERIYLLRQCLISITGLLHGICAGSVFGYTSILFPQLQINSNTTAIAIILTNDQQSWIASVPTLAMFPATLICGWTLEKFGRKKMALVGILFNLLGWLTMYFATSYEIMLTSRILSGIFAGMGYPIFLTYLGEVTDPKYRAFFLSFLPLGCTMGVFICQLMGTYFNWKTVALIISIIPVYNICILSLYISESYIWYKNRNDIKKAHVCYTWFRGFSPRAKEEFAKATEISSTKMSAEVDSSFKITFSTLANRSFLIPFGITTLAFITNQLSGNMALVFYTSTIVGIITNDTNVQYYSTIALNILRILATAASCVLVKMISVRKVLTFGGLALSVSLLNLSIFLYLSQTYPDTKAFPIVCMISVISNVIFFAISLGPLPSVICGELYPAETRGIGGPLSACCSFISLFVVVKVMPLMLSELTPAGTFLLFTICTFVGVIVLAFVLPDTKNKTLKEIESMYH